MFTLVCFSSPQPAYTLVDYLSSQHISGVVSKSEEQYCVELVNEADMAQAQIITAHFINAPHDPRYQAASWDNDNHQLYTSRSGSNSSIFNGFFNLQSKSQLTRYPLTYLIMLVNIVVFGMMIVSIETRLWVDSMLFIAPLHELQQTGQWWRLLTPNFLHFSGIHITFNLLWASRAVTRSFLESRTLTRRSVASFFFAARRVGAGVVPARAAQRRARRDRPSALDGGRDVRLRAGAHHQRAVRVLRRVRRGWGGMVLLARGDVLCGWGGMVAAPGPGDHTLPPRNLESRLCGRPPLAAAERLL